MGLRAEVVHARDPKFLLLFFVVVALGIATLNHVPGLNGPWYWQWEWRHLEGARLYPAMFVAFLPFVLAQYARLEEARRPAVPLSLLMLSALALQLTALGMQTKPFHPLGNIVYNISHPEITSYFTDAKKIKSVSSFLASFHELLPTLNLHSLTKPPGPILFHAMFVAPLGFTPVAALAAGITIVLLSTLSVPATYALVKGLTGSREAALNAASFFSLCPGFLLFSPGFDQIYPVLSSALILTWVFALERDRLWYSSAFGLILAVACFMTYAFFVLGIFLGLYSLAAASTSTVGVNSVKHVIVAAATFVLVELLNFALTGFNPISAFLVAVANESMLAAERAGTPLHRPYPVTILFDLTDFALGSGWIGVLLASYLLTQKIKRGGLRDREVMLTVLAFAQFFGTAASGLLRTETARAWLFMVPLLMVPVGLELQKWTFRLRMVVFVGLWFLTTAVAQNMSFIP